MMADPAVGTIRDVAAFFRCSTRTVRRWLAERPPRLTYWRSGGAVLVGEEAVLDAVTAGRVDSGRPAATSRDAIRAQWRACLARREQEEGPSGLPRADDQVKRLADDLSELRARVAELEQAIHPQQLKLVL